MCLQVLETESNDLALVAALESLTLWVKKFRETAVAALTEFIPKGIALKTSTSPGITNNRQFTSHSSPIYNECQTQEAKVLTPL